MIKVRNIDAIKRSSTVTLSGLCIALVFAECLSYKTKKAHCREKMLISQEGNVAIAGGNLELGRVFHCEHYVAPNGMYPTLGPHELSEDQDGYMNAVDEVAAHHVEFRRFGLEITSGHIIPRWGFHYVNLVRPRYWIVEQVIPYREYIIPIPYVILISAIWPCLYLFKVLRSAFRVGRNVCVECGYDLRASSERCPECGKLIQPKSMTKEAC